MKTTIDFFCIAISYLRRGGGGRARERERECGYVWEWRGRKENPSWDGAGGWGGEISLRELNYLTAEKIPLRWKPELRVDFSWELLHLNVCKRIKLNQKREEHGSKWRLVTFIFHFFFFKYSEDCTRGRGGEGGVSKMSR